jgi:O-methyltransferase/methyltransferase family protein
MDSQMISPERITRLGDAFKGAKTLLSAVELGVFTALAKEPMDTAKLRERIGIHERGARDFFDALVALQLLNRDEQGRYTNTPETARYLDRGRPDYLGALFELRNARQYGPWNNLTEALRSGKPQSGARGTAHFAAYHADQAVRDNFVKGMTAGALPVARVIAAVFPWREYRTVFDIGTAEGCLPVEIARSHSHITGGGFDLPAVRPMFNAYVADHGLADRLHFVDGDFFTDPLPKADVLVFGRVLHNWDLAGKAMLLSKAYDALPAGGAVIVYEALIDDARRENAQALLASLNMLVISAGGFDYSGADCVGWMRSAGFCNMRIEALTMGNSMVVGVK